MDKGQFLLYQTPDGVSKIEVSCRPYRLVVTRPNGRAFPTQQIHYFQTHKNVLEEGELDENMVVAKFAMTTKHGAIEGKTQEHLDHITTSI